MRDATRVAACSETMPWAIFRVRRSSRSSSRPPSSPGSRASSCRGLPTRSTFAWAWARRWAGSSCWRSREPARAGDHGLGSPAGPSRRGRRQPHRRHRDPDDGARPVRPGGRWRQAADLSRRVPDPGPRRRDGRDRRRGDADGHDPARVDRDRRRQPGVDRHRRDVAGRYLPHRPDPEAPAMAGDDARQPAWASPPSDAASDGPEAVREADHAAGRPPLRCGERGHPRRGCRARDERQPAGGPFGHQRRRVRGNVPGCGQRAAGDQHRNRGRPTRRQRARDRRHLRWQRLPAVPVRSCRFPGREAAPPDGRPRERLAGSARDRPDRDLRHRDHRSRRAASGRPGDRFA